MKTVFNCVQNKQLSGKFIQSIICINLTFVGLCNILIKMAVSYKMRKKEKCVRSKVKLNTFFLESLTLRNWGYSRCLKKHSEKKEDKNKLNNKMI